MDEDEDEEQGQPVARRRAASRPGARFRRVNPPAVPGEGPRALAREGFELNACSATSMAHRDTACVHLSRLE